MLDLLRILFSGLLSWNYDPDIDGVRAGIALIFVVAFVVLVVVCSGALVALRG